MLRRESPETWLPYALFWPVGRQQHSKRNQICGPFLVLTHLHPLWLIKYVSRLLQWLMLEGWVVQLPRVYWFKLKSFFLLGEMLLHMYSCFPRLTLRATCEVQVVAAALVVSDDGVHVLSERGLDWPQNSIMSGWPFDYITAWQKGTLTCPFEIHCETVSKLLNRCGKCVLAWLAAERSASHWKIHGALVLPSFTQFGLGTFTNNCYSKNSGSVDAMYVIGLEGYDSEI